MTKNRLINGRPTLTIDEALQIGKCDVADLFHKAEIGELTIYAIADDWVLGSITEIDHSIEYDIKNLKLFSLGTDGKPKQYDPKDLSQDTVCYNVITYSRHGRYKALYSRFDPLTGLQPIAAMTFEEHRILPEMIEIKIDLVRSPNIPIKGRERFLRPKQAVFVGDLLLNGKLVVMEADIKRLLSAPHPTENLYDFYDDPRWPTELDIAIEAWNAVRKTIKDGQKPGAAIRKWLKGSGRKFTDSAINRIATVANWDKDPGASKK